MTSELLQNIVNDMVCWGMTNLQFSSHLNDYFLPFFHIICSTSVCCCQVYSQHGADCSELHQSNLAPNFQIPQVIHTPAKVKHTYHHIASSFSDEYLQFLILTTKETITLCCSSPVHAGKWSTVQLAVTCLLH